MLYVNKGVGGKQALTNVSPKYHENTHTACQKAESKDVIELLKTPIFRKILIFLINSSHNEHYHF